MWTSMQNKIMHEQNRLEAMEVRSDFFEVCKAILVLAEAIASLENTVLKSLPMAGKGA